MCVGYSVIEDRMGGAGHKQLFVYPLLFHGNNGLLYGSAPFHRLLQGCSPYWVFISTSIDLPRSTVGSLKRTTNHQTKEERRGEEGKRGEEKKRKIHTRIMISMHAAYI